MNFGCSWVVGTCTCSCTSVLNFFLVLYGDITKCWWRTTHLTMLILNRTYWYITHVLSVYLCFNVWWYFFFFLFSRSLPPCQMISNKFLKLEQRFVTTCINYIYTNGSIMAIETIVFTLWRYINYAFLSLSPKILFLRMAMINFE